MTTRSCVTPQKKFIYGIHKPEYRCTNLRTEYQERSLGHLDTGENHSNSANYPPGDVQVHDADWIFEIPNPLPFRGSTYIDKVWADTSAADPARIRLPAKRELSLTNTLQKAEITDDFFKDLPIPVHLALATCSTDPADLIQLAELCCHIEKDEAGIPTGLRYRKDSQGRIRAVISNHALFEAVANNPALPDSYKEVMVLRPGAQGGSEIVGEVRSTEHKSHVYEYLRRNSYIAGGHYAANMADDAVRYSIARLTEEDMTGLRHLYYQRSFVRLAEELGLEKKQPLKQHSEESLERLRKEILAAVTAQSPPAGNATLWGWNFGFDYAPSDYRLHASHQQIHQQYAMIPRRVECYSGSLSKPEGSMNAFGCGDMVEEVITDYFREQKSCFFEDYIECIRNNVRMDERSDLESSLIVWENEHCMLFVPKAQTSQWELQLMALHNQENRVIGNILEADSASRASLNRGIFLAQKALAGLGARMVTSIEYPGRIQNSDSVRQHLLHSFLPRLPQSPGAFSEAQLRYINGHYPEDFAAVCRRELTKLNLLQGR